MKKLLLALLVVSAGFGQQTISLQSPAPAAVSSVSYSITGNIGSNTFYYHVIAKYPIGNAQSNSVQVTNAPNLSTSNSITVSWSAASTGVIGYDVLKTTTPNVPVPCTCLLSGNTTNTSVVDTGQSLTSYTLNSAPSAVSNITLDNQNYPTKRLISDTPVLSPGQGVLFTQLGKAITGATIYCFDCQSANPCAGGSTGAWAQAQNGVWNCANGGGGGGSLGIQVGGAAIGTRPNLNLISGTGITQSCADNGGSNRVDCTPSLNTAVALTNANAQAGKPWFCNSTNGTTAYTCSLNAAAALTSYTTGMYILFRGDTSSTAAQPTINIDGLGAKNIDLADGATNPGVGVIVANQFYFLEYNGTVFTLPSSIGVTTVTNSNANIVVTNPSGPTVSVGWIPQNGDYSFSQIANTTTVMQNTGPVINAVPFNSNVIGNTWSNSLLTIGTQNQFNFGAGLVWTPVTVAFNAGAPNFNLANGSLFNLTLTGAAVATQTNPTAGAIYGFHICQDATGGRTLTYPAGYSEIAAIDPTANICTNQFIWWDGTNAHAFGPATSNASALSFFGPTTAAPTSPGSGFMRGWFDTTDLRFHDKNTNGTIGTTVVANSLAAHNFANAISVAGVVSGAQPALADISDATAHGLANLRSCVAASGSGTAYTCTTSPSFVPAAKDEILFKADVANTGSATLNVNASSVATIKKQGGGTNLIANDLLVGQWIPLIFDGTNWQAQGLLGNSAAGITTVQSPPGTNITSQATIAARTGLMASGDVTNTRIPIDNIGVVDPNLFAISDEFCHGGTATGSIGELGWLISNVAGSATVSNPNVPTFTNPCSMELNTPATTTDGGWLNLQGGTGILGALYNNTQSGWAILWNFAMTSNVTEQVFIGIGSNGNPPTDFAGARFDTTLGDTSINLCLYNNTTTTTCSPTGTLDTNNHTILIMSDEYYNEKILQNSAATTSNLKVWMVFDGGAGVSFCAAGCTVTVTPRTNTILPFPYIVTQANTAIHLILDKFGAWSRVSTTANRRN